MNKQDGSSDSIAPEKSDAGSEGAKPSGNGDFGSVFPGETACRPTQRNKPSVLGAPGGPMDGGAAGRRDPNPSIPAGYTFLGQFIDHDITWTSGLFFDETATPGDLVNLRRPSLDLDSVYGGGPRQRPDLYRRDRLRFRLPPPTRAWDLPRLDDGTPLVGDPRNDDNIVTAQLHAAFLRFHNTWVDRLEGRVPRARLFEQARRLVEWHYQWIVVEEYLPLVCGGKMLDEVRNLDPDEWNTFPLVPVEFSLAAFRFGHSQVKSRYRVNGWTERPLLSDREPDLRGGASIPISARIEWDRFFEFPGASRELQESHRIDDRIAPVLFDLPVHGDPRLRSLPETTLQRGFDLGLPSGQTVARKLKGNGVDVVPLTDEEVWGDGAARDDAPLWYYILREASVRNEGVRLAGVGAWIVAMTIIGLLRRDPSSILSNGSRRMEKLLKKSFGTVDLLKIAGLDDWWSAPRERRTRATFPVNEPETTTWPA